MSRKYQLEVTKLEKQWGKKLSSILKELSYYQYKRMLMYLNQIPKQTKGKKGKKPRGKMAQLIIQHYGVEESIEEINNVARICKRDQKIRDLLQPTLKKLETVRALSQQQTGNEWRSAGAAGGENVQSSGRASKRKRQPSPQPEAVGSETPKKKRD